MIKSICFLVTEKCNAKCAYCSCGPDQTTTITLKQMIKNIDEALKLGTIAQVVFTGGEPTLLGDDLLKAIKYASDNKLATRIVTNGWWGFSEANSDHFVERLLEHGLSEINISIDDLHQEWIPIEAPTTALKSCFRKGLQCLVAYKRAKDPIITLETLRKASGIDLIEYKDGKQYSHSECCRLFLDGIIVPVGRPDPKKRKLIDGSIWGPCSSILSDIYINPRNEFVACCGIVSKDIDVLRVASLEEKNLLESIKKANNDLLLNWLALEGPLSIFEFIQSKNIEGRRMRKTFTTKCHLCDYLFTNETTRSILAMHYREKAFEISLHRGYFESIRGNEELIRAYRDFA